MKVRIKTYITFAEGMVKIANNPQHHHNGELVSSGKWGFIDKTGREVVPLKYDKVWNFHEGLAEVKVGGKKGYIDARGTEYWED